MENNTVLQIADFRIGLDGRNFCGFVGKSSAFRDFYSGGAPEFMAVEDLPDNSFDGCPESETLYRIEFEGINCRFGKHGSMLWFTMEDSVEGTRLVLRQEVGDKVVHSTSVLCRPTVTRFALWMAVNMLLVNRKCAAVHSSVNVCNGYAVMCLGESGTGKSTHTRLLRENFPEMFLLNDDSPFVKSCDDGRIMVYGSPWSGKTPCYKQMSFPLKAVIRLSQAPYNKIHRLSPLAAIGAVQPSLPPAFNYAEETSDPAYALVSDIVSSAEFWHLECLPDNAAAQLSYASIFGSLEKNV